MSTMPTRSSRLLACKVLSAGSCRSSVTAFRQPLDVGDFVGELQQRCVMHCVTRCATPGMMTLRIIAQPVHCLFCLQKRTVLCARAR